MENTSQEATVEDTVVIGSLTDSSSSEEEEVAVRGRVSNKYTHEGGEREESPVQSIPSEDDLRELFEANLKHRVSESPRYAIGLIQLILCQTIKSALEGGFRGYGEIVCVYAYFLFESIRGLSPTAAVGIFMAVAVAYQSGVFTIMLSMAIVVLILAIFK